jgi:hypothetical protein
MKFGSARWNYTAGTRKKIGGVSCAKVLPRLREKQHLARSGMNIFTDQSNMRYCQPFMRDSAAHIPMEIK